MQLTPEQVKGRIKNVAKENKADARTLMRIYMMERFVERVSNSKYKDNFIIKGGMLVTAMVGVANRSTMDIDTSLKNQNLSAEDARRIVDEIKDIDLGDGVIFEVKEVSNIMDEMEYPGIRFTMNAIMGKLITPMKIDISTGDVIIPRAIEYQYKLLLDDRSIRLWSYNLETILAEKLQTVLARGLLNTRMRDFYDIRTLLSIYEEEIDENVLKDAFEATCLSVSKNLVRKSWRGIFMPGNFKSKNLDFIFSLSALSRGAFLCIKRGGGHPHGIQNPEFRASLSRTAAIPRSSSKHWKA